MTTTPRVRRAALVCIAAAALTAAACSSGNNSADAIGEPVADETADAPSWLFSQTADSGRIEFTDGEATKLVLIGADAHSIKFSDRPDRLARIIDTGLLTDEWDDVFADSAPNAVLVEHRPEGETDSLVMVLSNPSFDSGARTLRYDIEVLADEDHPESISGLTGDVHASVPTEFQDASLFIDSACTAFCF